MKTIDCFSKEESSVWQIGLVEALAYGADALTLAAVAVQVNTISRAQGYRIARLDGYNKKARVGWVKDRFRSNFWERHEHQKRQIDRLMRSPDPLFTQQAIASLLNEIISAEIRVYDELVLQRNLDRADASAEASINYSGARWGLGFAALALGLHVLDSLSTVG